MEDEQTLALLSGQVEGGGEQMLKGVVQGAYVEHVAVGLAAVFVVALVE